MCSLDDFKHLQLDSYHRQILEKELDLWHRIYLPCGEYVVDIGAGNGETAQFFLNHGAKKVLCIEPDVTLLLRNFVADPRVQVWANPVTKIKSDCEGCEKNATFEVHFPYRLKTLQPNFPWRGGIVRLEEDWGGPLKKALRLIVAKIAPLVW